RRGALRRLRLQFQIASSIAADPGTRKAWATADVRKTSIESSPPPNAAKLSENQFSAIHPPGARRQAHSVAPRPISIGMVNKAALAGLWRQTGCPSTTRLYQYVRTSGSSSPNGPLR